jgi:hypothetical protein
MGSEGTNMLTGRELWNKLRELGVHVDNHESDLYVPCTQETEKLIEDYECKVNVSRFTSQVDGKRWFDVPFGYIPFWDKIEHRVRAMENDDG